MTENSLLDFGKLYCLCCSVYRATRLSLKIYPCPRIFVMFFLWVTTEICSHAELNACAGFHLLESENCELPLQVISGLLVMEFYNHPSYTYRVGFP